MNDPVHAWWRQVMRGVLMVAVFVVPGVGDLFSVPVISIALGAILAYEGLDGRTVSWSMVFLVAMELTWGMGIGVLSLPYLLTALVLRVVQGFFTIEPLSGRSVWRTLSLVRTSVFAWVIALVMTMLSILVQSWVYGQGSVSALGGSVIHPIGTFMAVTGCAALVMVSCLYRIDIPFRAKIYFGVY